MESESPNSKSLLQRLASLKPTGQQQAPKLPHFRVLQWLALGLSALWLIAALTVSDQLIQRQFERHLRTKEARLENEIQYLIGSFEQKLHQAEQLSKALSFDQSVIDLARRAKNREVKLSNYSLAERIRYLLSVPGASEVNSLFHTLTLNVDINQIFLQDHKAYCIATYGWQSEQSCIGLRYSQRAYFQQAKHHGKGRQFAIGRQVPEPSFFFSTAVGEAEFLGAVVVRMMPPEVVDFIGPKPPVTLIAADDGIVIYSTNPNYLYTHVGTTFSDLPSLEAFRQAYKQATLQPLPFSRVTRYQNHPIWQHNGITYLLGRAKVQNGDFQMFVFEDINELFRQRQHNWRLSYAAILVGLLLILLLERSVNYQQLRKAHLIALSDANAQLSNLSQELYHLTVTDALTGLSSRRYFSQRLEDEVARIQRHQTSSSGEKETTGVPALLEIDIDNFKHINDTYGHLAGDEAIRTMAGICRACVRPYDVVARIGGEEFAILLCESSASQAEKVANRILDKCRRTGICFEGQVFTQTCSIGMAMYRQNQNMEQFFSAADKALYSAKNRGRNRLEIS